MLTGQPAATLLPAGLGAALLFGLRLWASVCLALFVAYRLELENPFWAATSAAIVCQPTLGASLRKGGFRMLGTLVGAVAIVVMTAAFPQSRTGFLVALALWLGLCGFAAAILRNFASYAAALAGYTAAIVFADATGDPVQTFTLAVTRASEICIGIVCAGLVLAGTDFGTARRRLKSQLAGLVHDTAAGLATTLRAPRLDFAALQGERRALVLDAARLDPVIDEAVGEASDLRARSATLQRAVDGLFTALSGWRNLANHLQAAEAAGDASAREAVAAQPAWAVPDTGALGRTPDEIRRSLLHAVRLSLNSVAHTASARLIADRTADALLGLCRTLDGLILLAQPDRAGRHQTSALPRVADFLPPVLSLLRAVLTIGALAMFWIATAWQGGQLAITFAAVAITLFSPREDEAYGMAFGFTLGTVLTAGLAAVVQFAVLPAVTGFWGLCAVLGVVLVPLAAASTSTWHKPVLLAMMMNFVPILAPGNSPVYDPASFLNAALGIAVGTGAAALSFRLLPPLAPPVRIARLHDLTRDDFRALAAGHRPWRRRAWEGRVYSRLLALPPAATALDSAQLLSALSAGEEVLRLRSLTARSGLTATMQALTEALVRGEMDAARGAAVALCEAAETAGPNGLIATRTMASGRVLVDTLVRHGAYLAAGAMA